MISTSYWKLSFLFFLLAIGSIYCDSFIISGPTPFLNATVAIAGKDPEDVVDTSQSYSVEAGKGRSKITATLLTPLPTGVSLEVEFEAPKKARSKGSVDISDGGEKEIVSGIRKGDYNNLDITYSLKATTSSGLVLPQNLNISFKLEKDSRR